MPTEIIINSQKFYNQLKNGNNFSDNLYDFTYNLVGSVGERIRAITDISVYVHAITTPRPWIAQGYCKFTYKDSIKSLSRNTGSFISDGLSIGDNVAISWMSDAGVNKGDYLATITAISETELIFDDTPKFPGGEALPDSSINHGYAFMNVAVVSPLTAVIFSFGLIDNNELFNDKSKVSLNEQVYKCSGIGLDDGEGGRLTNEVYMQPLGVYRDWLTEYEPAKIAFISEYDFYRQQFRITHDFIINPYYINEWLDNLNDGTIPDLLNGQKTLKYAIKAEFRTVLSNPNTSKIAISDKVLGSVGYFNENYNGFDNNYTIESVEYSDVDTGNNCDGLQVAGRTKAVITVSRMGGFSHAPERFGVMVSYLPKDTSEYQNTLTTFEENFLYDNAVNTDNHSTVIGGNGIIKKCFAHIVDGGKIAITAEFEYDSDMQLKLQDNPKYILGVLIGEALLSSAESDKVMLIADYREYVYSADIPGLMYFSGQRGETDGFIITRHDNKISQKFTLWDEDGLIVYFKFWLNTQKNAIIKTLDIALLAYKMSDNSYFILDKININTANAPIIGGKQQLNYDSTRGYKLLDSDIFNKITLRTEEYGSPIYPYAQYYSLEIGQKIKWQDWIKNISADNTFYNVLKPNNNLNFKTDNYCSLQSGNADYSIRLAIIANVQGTNQLGLTGQTVYNLISPEQNIYDYEKPTYWTAIIETFDKTGTINLNGAIRYDDHTLMRVTWQFVNPISPANSIWSIHRIEESKENGDAIYEHSTLYDRIITAPFTDYTGAPLKRLKQTIDYNSNRVITENLIDYTKLNSNKKYKLSARINYDKLDAIIDAKITEDGIIKQTESSEQIKIIE